MKLSDINMPMYWLERGAYLVPCNSNYKPHGFWREGEDDAYHSSNDLGKIMEWNRKHPGCTWGVDLRKSGWVALDDDSAKRGAQSPFFSKLPRTLNAPSRSGLGRHYIFSRCGHEYTNKCPAPFDAGWDVCANSLLFVQMPEEENQELPIVALPVEILAPTIVVEREILPQREYQGNDEWANANLTLLLEEISTWQGGGWNNNLWRNAKDIYKMVGGGILEDSEALADQILDAAMAPVRYTENTRRRAESTIKSARNAGLKEPEYGFSNSECTRIPSIEISRDVILVHCDGVGNEGPDVAERIAQAFPQAFGYCQRALTKSLHKNHARGIEGICMRKMCGRWEDPVCADTVRAKMAEKYWSLIEGWDHGAGIHEVRPTSKWPTFYQYLKRHNVTEYLKWATPEGLVVWVPQQIDQSERVSAPLDKAITYFQGVTQKNEFSAARGLVGKESATDSATGNKAGVKPKDSEWKGAEAHNSKIFFNNMPKVLGDIPGVSIQDLKGRPIPKRRTFHWDWESSSDVGNAFGSYVRLMGALDAQDASIYESKEENERELCIHEQGR